MDLQGKVIKILGDTGEIVPQYGGYEITVVKPDRFPWYAVLDLLLETGQEIWITQKDGEIRIKTAPKIE